MNRASPADLRKAMEVARLYMQSGILFVPVPVLSDEDVQDLLKDVDRRLDLLAEGADS